MRKGYKLHTFTRSSQISYKEIHIRHIEIYTRDMHEIILEEKNRKGQHNGQDLPSGFWFRAKAKLDPRVQASPAEKNLV
jgi:hypothetical protein